LKAFSGATALGLLLLGVTTQSASAACQLNSSGGKVKRVVNIVFDNVHLRRDNPNVPSHMEQMPNLFNFLHDNGVISGNHHDPLISHTAHDIDTALTGVYGDRNGIPVANSYGYFKPDGSVGFNSSFLYWTAVAADGKPQMLDEFGKTAPAPWVAYTRAGCDVGAFSVANIEFERLPDDMTTFYGAGSTVDTAVRGELASSDPATQLSQLLADRAEMKLLHMLTASPARAPTLTMFGNDNYFFETVSKPPATACQQQSDCVFVGPSFAWNHGDYQQEITRTWVAIAGPGVQRLGRDDAVFTDHADVRPTIVALLGLKDDYVHEGRVVAEWMQPQALPSGIAKAQANFTELATVFKQLDAPVGDLGRASLVWANKSITGTNQTYLAYLKQMDGIIQQRQDLAFKIKNTLHAAAFAGQPVDLGTVDSLGNQAQDLINKVNTLAEGASN